MENGKKVAFITGISGQDGSYLAEFLLSKGYEVHGILVIEAVSNLNSIRLDNIIKQRREKGLPSVYLYYADITDGTRMLGLLEKIKPNEVYHLAAQPQVKASEENPIRTAEVIAIGTLKLLEAIRILRESGGVPKDIKFYQASTSEMFGISPSPQSELTPFNPVSPYAISKTFAHHATAWYRKAFGIFACNGILFNHESPRRGEEWVTRRISKTVANIKYGRQNKLYLGNLNAKRDFGYAPEYVEMMWRMLQQSEPDDYVVGTGESHSVQEIVEEAFSYAGLGDWRKYVEVDSNLFRKMEPDLCADSSKATQKLGWAPKVKFKELIHVLVDADIKAVQEEMQREKVGIN